MPAPKVSLASLAIPFRHAFAHASAVRRQAANVLVRVDGPEGYTGYGEGCPREYVTGESVAQTMAFLRQNAAVVAAEVSDLDQLRRWLAANVALADAHPSAVCALEMALLDLFARRAGLSVEALLGAPRPGGPLAVSAVYGTRSSLAFDVLRWRFGRAGMTDAKLKITGRAGVDSSRAARLARRGPVRLDANNLWPDAPSAIEGLRAVARHAWAVEEPVAARDWPAMAEVGAATGLAVILDESFITVRDLMAPPAGLSWVANVRVARLGGVIRSLEAIAAAKARGFGLIVGAHVGETSLLARAGLLAAAACGDGLRATEIGYGGHLLARDPFGPEIAFGRDGKIAPPSPGAGWALTPDARLTAAFG